MSRHDLSVHSTDVDPGVQAHLVMHISNVTADSTASTCGTHGVQAVQSVRVLAPKKVATHLKGMVAVSVAVQHVDRDYHQIKVLQ